MTDELEIGKEYYFRVTNSKAYIGTLKSFDNRVAVIFNIVLLKIWEDEGQSQSFDISKQDETFTISIPIDNCKYFSANIYLDETKEARE